MSYPTRCEVHGMLLERKEVREYPGKTIEVCPLCEKEKRDSIMEYFGVTAMNDAN